MAEDKKVITIQYDVDSKEVVQSTKVVQENTGANKANANSVNEVANASKSFKTQLREANQELLKTSQAFGATSKEAVIAAKKVADLKDQMGEAKSLVEGFNPDRKFQGMATAVGMAATSATALTAGMALLGVEGEDTTKMLLKVQAAMAFSDSIGRLTEMGDDFNKLKAQLTAFLTAKTTATTVDTVALEANTVATAQGVVATEASVVALESETVAATTATTATWLLLAPIVAITAGISALVYAIGYFSGAWGDYSGKAAEAEKITSNVNSELSILETTVKSNSDSLSRYNKHQLALAKAAGKSASEIHKLENELAESETNEARRAVAKADRLAQDALRGGDKATIDKAFTFLRSMEKIRDESFQRELDVNDNFEIAKVQAQTDANAKAIEEAKKHQDDLKKIKDDKIKQEAADLKAGLLAQKTAENDAKNQKALDDEKAFDEALKISNDAKKKNEDALKTENQIKVDAENLDFETKKAALILQKLSIEEIEAEHKRNVSVLNDEYFAAEAEKAITRDATKKEQDDKAAADKIESDEKVKAALTASAKLFNDSMSSIQKSGLDKTKAGQIASKALGLTQIAIDSGVALGSATKLATAEGIAAQIALPMVPGIGTAAKVVSYVSTAATIASNVMRAKALLSGGGSAGGSSSAGNASSSRIPAQASPQVGFQQSQSAQIAGSINGAKENSQPVQAFISLSDLNIANNTNNSQKSSSSF